MITLRANAKINLTLDVLYKRPDNYHQVEMIMQAIDLADIIHIKELSHDEVVVNTNVANLPCNQNNLAYKAAALLKDILHINNGVQIALEKNIPIAAGLAGGSSNAAAVLSGLNKLWNLGLSISELEGLGAQLGSDVPFCLRGGTMLATGRGEILSPLKDIPPCYVVLAKSPIGVSTAWVYGNYQADAVKVHPDTKGMINYLANGDLKGVANSLYNVLESVTIAKYKEIQELKADMIKYGAMASLMSGSGPTVFGLVESREKAEYIANKLRDHSAADVFVAKTVARVED